VQINSKSVIIRVDVQFNLNNLEIISTTAEKNQTSLVGLCPSAIYISYCENVNDFICETREEVQNNYLLAASSSKILAEKWK
jgi:hypothetical protein